jgi:hypothetical protein
MSIGMFWGWVEAYEGVWRVFWRSVAKIVIRVRRWAKEAAEGALSAFRVLNRRRRRWGPGVVLMGFESLERALRARCRCAVLGGLKEESRTMSVWGWVVGGEAGSGVRVLG